MNQDVKALPSLDLSSANIDVLHFRRSLRVKNQLNFSFFISRQAPLVLKLPTFDETRRDWLSSFTFMPKTHHLQKSSLIRNGLTMSTFSV